MLDELRAYLLTNSGSGTERVLDHEPSTSWYIYAGSELVYPEFKQSVLIAEGTITTNQVTTGSRAWGLSYCLKSAQDEGHSFCMVVLDIGKRSDLTVLQIGVKNFNH